MNHPETINFDGDASGAVPRGWIGGSTGCGVPEWAVADDPTAPSKPNVLKQSGSATFPFCVLQRSALADGSGEVKFKALAGQEDQACGVLRRFKNGDNYYVARANAQLYIDVFDTHIDGAGAVGVCSKADSVTAFDDFVFASQ